MNCSTSVETLSTTISFRKYQEQDSGNSSNCSSELSTSKHTDFEEDDFSSTSFGSLNLNKAPLDFNLLNDERSLENLLYLEDFYRIQTNYFEHFQKDIKPWMRKHLADWMLEVCKNQTKEDDVFVTAMNILDRFLSVQTISKRHLQLLGTVCMFIAAKLRSAVQFNAETLVIYTANSITIEELLQWEQFVLAKLRWDINTITAFDYVPYLLNKLNIIENKNIASIRQYLSTFISLCSTNIKFSLVPSSMIAHGCLYLTLKYLNNLDNAQCEPVLLEIHSISSTSIDLELLSQCIEQIDEILTTDLKLKSRF